MLRQRIITELMKPKALEDLAHVSAELIGDITGIDRVMIYRFAEDKHGEVIAESTTREDSFMGLHYPASDIPDPARRHFVQNIIRTIPDINAPSSPILAESLVVADAASANPLDLTYSRLRAVAPVHTEYLNNMGVGGSLSISLVTNERLWGLVACHHYSAWPISSSRLRFAELLGVTISSLLQTIENTDKLQQSIKAEKTAFEIEKKALGKKLSDIVPERAQELMQLFGAQGLICRLGGKTLQAGEVPDAKLDFDVLRETAVDGIATSSHLSSIIPKAADYVAVAAGAAFLTLSEDGSDYVIFLREEFEQTINWAGRPEKIEKKDHDGTPRLSPRGSFALWSEERRGTSRPFDAMDQEALRIVRRALFALNSVERERVALRAMKDAEAEEARLRHTLLDAGRTTAMSELASALAHELNQPLAALANYVNACRQELRNASVPIPERASNFIEDAITEAARAGDLVRGLRNFITGGDLALEQIDLAQIIQQSIRLAFDFDKSEGVEVRFQLADDVPAIFADPVQIGQVILNLTKNSLAAMQGLESRVLTVTSTSNSETVEISVIDTGHGVLEEIRGKMFEPFHASTTNGMGIGLSLCRSIVEAHGGRIWANAPDSGAEFVFSLPIRGEVSDAG
jgi:light-regulated signal transduction histidine kinase (bacteriophytochrome)